MAEQTQDMPDIPNPSTLKKQWSDAPHLPDKKIEESKDGEIKAPPAHAAFSVHPGNLRDTENGLLGELTDQVNKYNELREHVQKVKATIFMPQQPPDWVKIAFAHGDAYQEIEWGKLKKENPDMIGGTLFGATEKDSIEYGDVMENCLQSCADMLHLVGEYVQRLNEAAQLYVAADIAATVPDPPKIDI